MLLQEADSIFDTDGFRLIMDWIEAESGIGYGSSPAATKAHRVLSDHGRGMTFLIAEGVRPSNEGRGYILRRLIRRAVVQARRIGLEGVFRLPAIVVGQVGQWYPEVVEHADRIESVVKAEEERFRETLERGLKVFDELAGKDAISGEDAFTLAATYGFPLELTVELAEERGQPVDVDDYRSRMAEHRDDLAGGRRVRHAARRRLRARRRSDDVRRLSTRPTCSRSSTPRGSRRRLVPRQAARVAVLSGRWWPGLRSGCDRARRRPDHPGGACRRARIGDDQVLLFRGDGFSAGSRVQAVVPWSVRFPTMANHTATHLLQEALREVLGDHVKQAGSAVRPDKLRFDFTHAHQLTTDERDEVEHRVNRAIFENHPLHVFETPIDEARKLGAMMLFGEKYGDIVRVVEIEGVSTRALRRHPRPFDGRDRFRSRSSPKARSARVHAVSRPSLRARRGHCCTAARASSTLCARSSTKRARS